MDIKDHRAAGLTFLISILPFLKNAPKYLFLENVVGFEVNFEITDYSTPSLEKYS